MIVSLSIVSSYTLPLIHPYYLFSRPGTQPHAGYSTLLVSREISSHEQTACRVEGASHSRQQRKREKERSVLLISVAKSEYTVKEIAALSVEFSS